MTIDKDTMRALEQDGEKLRQMTSEDHVTTFLYDEMTNIIIITEEMIAAGAEAIMKADKACKDYDELAHVCLVAALAVQKQDDLSDLAKTLRENTVKLRFFRGAAYDGSADEYLRQLTVFIDRVEPLIVAALQKDAADAR